MRILRLVPEGEAGRWYEGLAWRNFLSPGNVVAPMPLHWIARYARRAWYWCMLAGGSNGQVDRDAILLRLAQQGLA